MHLAAGMEELGRACAFRPPRPSLMAAAVALCYILGLTAWLYYGWRDYQTAIRQNHSTAENTALLLAEHARFSFEASEAVLQRAADRIAAVGLDRIGASGADQAYFRGLVADRPQIKAVRIYDRNGAILLDAAAPPASPNGDAAIPRLFPFSRRLTGSGNEAVGRVAVMIDAAYFENFYRSLVTGPNSMLTLQRENGEVLARFGRNDGPAVPDAAELSAMNVMTKLGDSPAATFESSTPWDGAPRIVSYRRVEGQPLIAAVSVAMDDALLDWRIHIVTGGASALAVLCLMAMLAWLSLEGRKREEKALRALRRSDERFRTALEMSPDGFAILRPITGKNGRIRDFQPLYANSAALRRCGLTETDIQGATLLQLFPDAAGPRGFFASHVAVAETGIPYDGIHRLDTARLAGWFRTQILKVNDGIAVSFEDVSQQVLAEKELEAARRKAEMANRAKSRFLAAASHDLRQPFQAMELYHHLLMALLTDARHCDVARRLGEAMDAGKELLNALLDISTLEAGTLKPKISIFPVQVCLDHLAQELGPQIAAKGLRLTVMPSSALIRSDPVLLERLLRNLMTNALRYTDRGRILVGCRRHAGYLVMEVWDTGPGIPDDRLEIIFEDFYQLGNPERDRRRGLGLGLSIVKRTADILGHAVTVRSTPGKGSVFAIGVPLIRHAPAQTEDAPVP